MAWRETVNKSTTKPAAPKPKFDTKDDDWETDIAYENASTEKSQRYGSASVPGSGRLDHVDLGTLQTKMKTVDQAVKEDFKEKNPTRGYGGKYGTEQVMDKAAEGWSYKADVQKHSSQTDMKKGFGGQYGIDERAKDKAAVGFDYKPTLEKHSSQTVAADTKQETQQEEPKKPAVVSPTSPTPPSPLPKPAVKTPTTPTPPSPLPKPAAKPVQTEKPTTPTSGKADVGNIRARFENLGKEKEAEAAQRVAEERKKRAAADQKLQEQQQQQQKSISSAPKEPQETVEQPTPVSPPQEEPLESAPDTSIPTPGPDETVETSEPSTNNEQSDEPVGPVASSTNDDDEWSEK